MKVNITYRGWAGHLICSSTCLFRLNTLLEREDGFNVIVSTVGNNHDQSGKGLQIGHNRSYETKAFESLYDFYNDADVYNEINFESEWSLNGHTKENELTANLMHSYAVEEIRYKMEMGTINSNRGGK